MDCCSGHSYDLSQEDGENVNHMTPPSSPDIISTSPRLTILVSLGNTDTNCIFNMWFTNLEVFYDVSKIGYSRPS